MNVKPWSTVGPGVNAQVVSRASSICCGRGVTRSLSTGLYDPATVAAVPPSSRAGSRGGRHRRPTDLARPRRHDADGIDRRRGARRPAVRLVPSAGLPPLTVDGNYGPVTARAGRGLPEVLGAHCRWSGRPRDVVVPEHVPARPATLGPREAGRDAGGPTGECSRRSTFFVPTARGSSPTASSVRRAGPLRRRSSRHCATTEISTTLGRSTGRI